MSDKHTFAVIISYLCGSQMWESLIGLFDVAGKLSAADEHIL